MSSIFPQCPQPPAWHLDWQSLLSEHAFLRRMAECPQDPVHHGEGDVETHTRMVCQELTSDPRWRELGSREREILFAAALLHDVAKPFVTRREGGRITSRGHARRGSIRARTLLWEMGVEFGIREQIAALVRYHMTPFHLLERADSLRTLYRVSQAARCGLLGVLAEADARGRIAPDRAQLIESVALFVEYAREQQCLMHPRAFASDHSRFLYFRKEDRDPDYLAYDDTVCEVVLMSGLPGAGKDYWIGENLPDWEVVSLDAMRREMNINPKERQGRVVSAARERSRVFLRRKQSFVWNATNISHQVREQCINLFAAYNARVRIVYLDVPETRLFEQNSARAEEVPAAVIRGLLDRWEVPDRTEAHRVDWVVITNIVNLNEMW
ncbi:MAG: AAA family ATPase [Pyrinomonadaceae bacterium MAG19_C2-C3]|nr:AAA family ATPase [Pyrinomonadaceae bacterium MAG19_C2-C3]